MLRIPRKHPEVEGPDFPVWWLWMGRVLLACPNGHVARLDQHEIDASGRVTPSVQCPICDFHQNIELAGWR